MKKIVFLIFLFLSCENKYKNGEIQQGRKEQVVNVDGEEYKISGEIDLQRQNEK
jgi:hypothetical protein